MHRFFTVLSVLTTLMPLLEAAEERTPKASIILAEPEWRAQGCAQYRMVLENFPVNRQIMISMRRVIQEYPRVFRTNETISIDEQGLIQFGKHLKVRIYGLDPQGFAPGERVEYRFEDQHQQLCQVSYIPKPIVATSKEGTFTMEAELLTFAPITTWRLLFQGLEEGEVFSLISNSCGEILTKQSPYDSNGMYILAPDVKGKEGGTDEVTVRRSSGDEAFLSLPWGTRIITDLEQELSKRLPADPNINIIDGRFYTKNMAFSFLVPDKFRSGTICENVHGTLSKVILTEEATNRGQIVVDVIQDWGKKSIGTDGKPSSILSKTPSTRVLQEEEWEDKQHTGFFVLMEEPKGVRIINSLGDVEDIDAIEGHLITVIDGNLVSTCVRDDVFSFKWFGQYFSLEVIKNELLSQAVDLLKSYRPECSAASALQGRHP